LCPTQPGRAAVDWLKEAIAVRISPCPPPDGSVDLYWLPLGAGGRCVRANGRVFEAVAALRDGRPACDLYHSALEVRLGAGRWTIEMAPAWNTREPHRGVVGEGAVGLTWLGRSRWFRYEVRCWAGGRIPDVGEAVDSPQRMSSDAAHARRVLALVPRFHTATWALDEQHTGDMWNSNSLVSWLLAASGHDTTSVRPPAGGCAPGWDAGLVAAARELSGATP
jgi:hypothetical protein